MLEEEITLYAIIYFLGYIINIIRNFFLRMVDVKDLFSDLNETDPTLVLMYHT
jgi:hypothetical protein